MNVGSHHENDVLTLHDIILGRDFDSNFLYVFFIIMIVLGKLS